jgi:mono/diheme cytochrome c family protein
MTVSRLRTLSIICALAAMSVSHAPAAEPTAAQAKFFETNIRPLLVKNCVGCHGPKKHKSGLRLDSRAAMLKGGESGAAIVAGKPGESLLVEAIEYESFEMPPKGQLPERSIELIKRWIAMGAPWPQDADVRPAGVSFTEHEKNYWAFRPLTKPQPPEVDDARFAQTAVDRFIARKLREARLKPAAAADKLTLLRRATFDLHGLPPTQEQIATFLEDDSPDAFAKMVDRLLDSPRYGERWARHWLDLVRYAESDGYKADFYRPLIWRYRDYVIESLNEDKPYNRFVMEQLAGDEIAPDDPAALTATGFLRHYIYEYNQRDAETQWTTILNDLTDTTGEVFLGLGIGCARCHDHKFDPILQKDYYRLQAFLAPIKPREDVPLATPEQIAEYDKRYALWEEKTAAIRAEIDKQLGGTLTSIRERHTDTFPPNVQVMMRKDPGERTPYETQIAELALRQCTEKQLDHLKKVKASKDKKYKRLHELYDKLAEFDDLKPKPLPLGMVATDVGREAPTTHIPDDPEKTPIAPGFLSVFDPSDVDPPAPEAAPDSTGRRTALARWITDPANPLTNRVIVNRVWQNHFGRGIVSTASDFGSLGSQPSHPELLDWLVEEFVSHGWSLKHLHRALMNTETYRMSAFHPELERAMLVDPENRLRWHWEIRRLDAEQIRDAALATSGELEYVAGGPSVDAPQPRRSVYTKYKRNTHDPLLAAFDLPDGITSAPKRNVTTTPTQALLMINGSWALARARHMAERLSREKYATNRELARAAYRLAYSAEPGDAVLADLVEFLETQPDTVNRGARTDGLDEIPGRNGTAAVLKHGTTLKVPYSDQLPAGNFTIEAVVVLHSMYEDATVRTIVSQWDDSKQHGGWSLGVTSKRSAYKPRNFILQFVGKTADGATRYEVVPSDIHLELNRPYHVAASVTIADPKETGVTFYVRDLTANTLQRAQATHTVLGDYRGRADLVIGGRHGSKRHKWDGLIDDVRLTPAALDEQQLLGGARAGEAQPIGFWQFETKPGLYANAVEDGPAMHAGDADSDPRRAALVDLCHVLLNSNRFLYVD